MDEWQAWLILAVVFGVPALLLWRWRGERSRVRTRRERREDSYLPFPGDDQGGDMHLEFGPERLRYTKRPKSR